MPDNSDPAGGSNNPAADAMPHWERVVEDMAATAEEYRERGWDAHEVHPGDVAILTGDVERTGIDLLAPDNEFDPVAEAFDEAGGFDNAQVFRADTGGTVYVVVALEDPGAETAVLYAAYFSPGQHTDFLEMVEEEGEVRTHLRPLNKRRVLTFTHEDPSLFLPEE